MNSTNDAGGMKIMDSGLQSLAQLSKGAQAIAAEATGYTRTSFESAAVTLEKLLDARSLDAAMRLQADYARKTYEGLVAETSRIGGLYADMASQAYKPFESLVARRR